MPDSLTMSFHFHFIIFKSAAINYEIILYIVEIIELFAIKITNEQTLLQFRVCRIIYTKRYFIVVINSSAYFSPALSIVNLK